VKTALFLLLFFAFMHRLDAQSDGAPTIEASLVNMVKNTLSLSPFIKQQALQVSSREADIQISQSAFDVNLSSGLSYLHTGNLLFDKDPLNQVVTNGIRNREGQFNVGMQKNFENSLSIQSGVSWNRKADNIPFDEFQEKRAPFTVKNRGNVSLSIIQPLLKDRGRAVATANLRANSKFLAANQNNFNQIVAREVWLAIRFYWQYVGAYQILKVKEQSEARVRKLLDMTQSLIAADKKPAADLWQIQADLADKQAQTRIAELNVLAIEQQLKRVVGFDASVKLGIPVDSFPSPKDVGYLDTINYETMYDIALKNRPELKSLKLNQEALSDILLLSQNNLKPKLDLEGSVGYGGLSKGNNVSQLLALYGNRQGRNWNADISLIYLFPLQNNRAKAALTQQNIALQNQKILLENEARNIKLDLNVSIIDVQQSYKAYERNLQSFQFARTAFVIEQDKFQNGLTTILNVILFQERLDAFQIEYILNRQQFTIDLAKLRYETGILFPKEYFAKSELALLDFHIIPN
jgi:outer membrane protein